MNCQECLLPIKDGEDVTAVLGPRKTGIGASRDDRLGIVGYSHAWHLRAAMALP